MFVNLDNTGVKGSKWPLLYIALLLGLYSILMVSFIETFSP